MTKEFPMTNDQSQRGGGDAAAAPMGSGDLQKRMYIRNHEPDFDAAGKHGTGKSREPAGWKANACQLKHGGFDPGEFLKLISISF
jgi:hypothetical protein